MNCHKAKRLVDAYVDCELDVATTVDLEDHLESCPECSWARETRAALRSAVRAGERHRAPDGLEASLRTAVRGAAEAEAASRSRPAPVPVVVAFRPRGLRFAAAAAALIVAAAAFGVVWRVASTSAGDEVARDAVASHVRSLMADHLTDVPSSDQHTVKPWFAGRLDFAPPVVDLADQDFALVGGRLDYIDGSPAAALVYTRRHHTINLFVRPSDASAAERVESDRGFNVVTWAEDSMSYCAVSDLNAAELREFAEAIRGRARAPKAP